MLMNQFTAKLRRFYLEISKLKGYINISHKAGYLIIGCDALRNYKKKLYLIIYDKSSQKNTLKVVENLKKSNIACFEVDNLEELSSIKNCKIIGIKNKNLSELIENMLKSKE